jgi:hypothetical protein
MSNYSEYDFEDLDPDEFLDESELFDIEDYVIPCNACFGTGQDRELDSDCLVCYGDGVV